MSSFWKPGTSGPGGLDRGEDDAAQLVNPKLADLPLNTQRQSLPIYRHRNSLLFALQKYRATVLVGETGCGKTTQVSLSYAERERELNNFQEGHLSLTSDDPCTLPVYGTSSGTRRAAGVPSTKSHVPIECYVAFINCSGT